MGVRVGVWARGIITIGKFLLGDNFWGERGKGLEREIGLGVRVWEGKVDYLQQSDFVGDNFWGERVGKGI